MNLIFFFFFLQIFYFLFSIFYMELSCIAISDLFFYLKFISSRNKIAIDKNLTDRIPTMFVVYIYLHESAIKLELFSVSNLFDALMDIVDSLKWHPDSRNVILMAGR